MGYTALGEGVGRESKQREVKMDQKSNAVKKFQSRHPEQHKVFSAIFQSAKQTRQCVFTLPAETEEINGEWSNMIRNQDLAKYREEDETHRRTNCLGKAVTWSENLLDIRTISPPDPCSPWQQTLSFQSSYQNISGENWIGKEKISEGKESFEFRKCSYAEVVASTTRLVTQESSQKIFGRNR